MIPSISWAHTSIFCMLPIANNGGHDDDKDDDDDDDDEDDDDEISIGDVNDNTTPDTNVPCGQPLLWVPQ